MLGGARVKYRRGPGLGESEAKGPMPSQRHDLEHTATLGILLCPVRGWAAWSLTSFPVLTFWESMNVIKFMNRLLCLEQVGLKYMQIALSIAVSLLRRQSGIFT